MDEEVREFFRTPATRSRTTFAIGHGGGKKGTEDIYA